MTNQFAAGLVARLHRLAEQLTGLRERVRAAVATEAGRAVGEAVRDLFTAAVGGRIQPPAAPSAPAPPRPGRPWGRDPDDWEDNEDEYDPYPGRPGSPPHPRSEQPPPQPVLSAVRAGGATAARWCAARTGRAWAGAGLGVLTAVAAAGNPVVRAAAAVLAAVAELVTGVPSPVPPVI